MKKIILAIVFSLSFMSLPAQIILDKKLVDSLLSEVVAKTYDPLFPNLDVVKFNQFPDRKREVLLSTTFITCRSDIPDNSYLYYGNGCIALLTFNQCYLHSELLEIMINKTDNRFVKILDSLKFPYRARSGVVVERLTIDVVTIKKRRFSSNVYKLDYQKIFPASSAPKELLPVAKT